MKAAPIPPDQIDAALIAQGAALDAAAAPPPVDAKGQPVAPVDPTAEAAELVGLICSGVEFVYADSGLEFSPATRAKLAAAWAPVLEKYDITTAGFLGQYSAEIGAAIVTVPVIMAARKVVAAGKQKGVNPAADAVAASAPGEPRQADPLMGSGAVSIDLDAPNAASDE